MLCHVIIGLQYWSHECTPSWTSDDEEEYTEVMEKYWRKHLVGGGCQLNSE